MKKGIHPLKKKINVIMTDGSFFNTTLVTVYHKNHLKLNIDTKKHPCWNLHDDSRSIETGGRRTRFKQKYV